MNGMTRKRLFQGFICVQILSQASREPFFGSWLIEELSDLGYKLSPGTVYPILHSMEHEGLLKHYFENVEGKVRKYYVITQEGKLELQKARRYMAELADSIDHDPVSYSVSV